jgi:hypothetical protein
VTLPLPWTVVEGQTGELADTQTAYRLLMPSAEAARAGLLAVDTFTRPDAADLGSTENGLLWETHAGSFTVASGKAASAVTSTVATDVGEADVDVSAVITPTSGAPGLGFRMGTDNSTRLTVQLDVTNSLFNLQKTVSGTTTSIGSATQTITPGASYLVRVLALGTSISCYLVGLGAVTVSIAPLTYTLSTGEQSTFGALTRCGMRNTGSAVFDNFVVRPAFSAGSGSAPTYANLPAGTTLTVQESGGAYTRPTSRADLFCIFVGTSNPGAVALEGDLWAQTS